MGNIIVNSQNKPYLVNGCALEFRPYDSEIEYLESTGTQYINTLYNPAQHTSLIIEAKLTNSPSETTIAGLYDASRLARFHIGIYQAKWHFGCSNSSGSASWINFESPTINLEKHVFELQSSGYCCVDSTSNQISNVRLGSFISPIYLFCRCRGDKGNIADSFSNVRIYSVKIYENGNLMRFFTPVRIGQVGYMYDQINGTFYENAGTGSFVLGPDII